MRQTVPNLKIIDSYLNCKQNLHYARNSDWKLCAMWHLKINGNAVDIILLDWRQCGNSLALCYFAIVMELPDSLLMNCKSEFGVIFLRCSPT